MQNFAICLIAAFIAILIASPSIADSEDLRLLDEDVGRSHPEIIYQIVTSIGRPDEQGLIGRNRQWGELYSVRFQYGAGRALRHGLASDDPAIVSHSMRAIRAGLHTLEADGSFPATVPSHVAGGRQPSVADQAPATAFFLSDTCTALLLTQPTSEELGQIAAAIGWLQSHNLTLRNRDRMAPNRLFISALAFVSCGQLVDDEEVVVNAYPFIEDALSFVQDDGVVLEAGGADTSYQSVNLVAAIEIAALLENVTNNVELNEAIRLGSLWLVNRVGPDGAVNSAGNTRTCADEAFLGRPKEVDLREVFRALAYAEAMDIPVSDGLVRFRSWLVTQPDPCTGNTQN